jgi:hypothetical protein
MEMSDEFDAEQSASPAIMSLIRERIGHEDERSEIMLAELWSSNSRTGRAIHPQAMPMQEVLSSDSASGLYIPPQEMSAEEVPSSGFSVRESRPENGSVSNRPRLRTGYGVTVGTGDFSGQGNVVDAMELLSMFCEQGIPAKDVVAHIPFMAGRTVTNPSPYVGLERLGIPAKYSDRVNRNPIMCRGLIVNDLLALAKRAEIEAVVWFLLDHEHRDSIVLGEPGAVIEAGCLASIYDDWPAGKPLFIVADSSCSSEYAKSVLEELAESGRPWPTAWLTSGSGRPATSAIVVSDDEDDNLVNHDEQTDLRYSIYGGLLPQSLMRIIVYTNLNFRVEQLGRVLREGCGNSIGIEADMCESAEWMRDISLRDLFGGPIDPDRVVSVDSGSRLFREIIPPGPRLDDVGRFTARISGMIRFVRVRRNEVGAIEETERGYLLPGHPILESLLSRDPPPPPKPSYVPVNRIVDATLERIHRRYPRMESLPPGRKFNELSSQIFDFVNDLNQVDPRQTKALMWLSVWGNGVAPTAMFEMIREARAEVAAELGIDLNGHDTSRAWWMTPGRNRSVDARST